MSIYIIVIISPDGEIEDVDIGYSDINVENIICDWKNYYNDDDHKYLVFNKYLDIDIKIG